MVNVLFVAIFFFFKFGAKVAVLFQFFSWKSQINRKSHIIY